LQNAKSAQLARAPGGSSTVTSMPSPLPVLPQSVLWGLLPGLVTSCIGAYKDTLYEEFEPLKFFRSAIVTFLWYLLIDRWFPSDPVLLKIGACSMMERVSVELYKAAFKPEPGKFKNCTCDAVGACTTVHKDRGWLLDRLRGTGANYTGRMTL
jgi:hypothetical protein